MWHMWQIVIILKLTKITSLETKITQNDTLHNFNLWFQYKPFWKTSPKLKMINFWPLHGQKLSPNFDPGRSTGQDDQNKDFLNLKWLKIGFRASIFYQNRSDIFSTYHRTLKISRWTWLIEIIIQCIVMSTPTCINKE